MKIFVLILACALSPSLGAAAVSINDVKQNIDTDVSVVNWMGQKKLINDKHNGTIKIKDGHVVFNSKGQPQSAEVIIDMKSITNKDVKDKKYRKKLVKHLSSPDFFDVSQYPTAILKIKSFDRLKVNKKSKAKELNLYKAIGELKIKDKTKKIDFDVKIDKVAKAHKAFGKLKIDRTKWDVRYGSDSFFKGLGDKVIANDMEFDFELKTMSAVAKQN